MSLDICLINYFYTASIRATCELLPQLQSLLIHLNSFPDPHQLQHHARNLLHLRLLISHQTVWPTHRPASDWLGTAVRHFMMLIDHGCFPQLQSLVIVYVIAARPTLLVHDPIIFRTQNTKQDM